MTSSTMVDDPRVIVSEGLAGWRARLRHGDIGQLPVVVGLILIWGIFGYATNLTFFKPENMVDLSNQMAATGTIAVGVVFVLLLGEIDLTVGVVSGLCAAIMAVLTVNYGLPGPLGVLVGILAGSAIGLFQGTWFARVGIPSFVVTLAGLIGWQGLQLWVLGPIGTFNIRNAFVLDITSTYFNLPEALVIGVLFVAYFAVTSILVRRSRLNAGLRVGPMWGLIFRLVAIAVPVFLVIWWLERERGLPLSLVLLVGLIVVTDYVLRRTRFGRMIYAVGGNKEAALRAGIPVQRVRIAAFVICSTLAAWGGIMQASRGLNVSQLSGGGDVLLNAIAAAVIGGTSLFGGRGTAWAALLGILVIQSVALGMNLLNLTSDIKFMVTGIVLLSAVTIDAVARRGRPTGR